jgi:uncharacterized membrane protein (DUF4010 family)
MAPMIATEMEIASRLAIAGLVGLAAGLEREWSGHTSGPDARFAGLRTFFLLGLVGGIAGVFAAESEVAIGAVLALSGAMLSIAGYAMAVRRPTATTDGTTEAAALSIVALGVVAGYGWLATAAGAGAVVVLMLSEKARLHWLVRRLDERELHAGLQFAVLAVVVLPLLPRGPLFGLLAIAPRSLWMIVLLFSALNFAGFIARRAVGAGRGYSITGALGGVVSSTAITLGFSRQSREDHELGAPLARGVIAACTVLIPRVLVVSAALNPGVALALIPLLVPAFVIGVLLVALAWRRSDPAVVTSTAADTGNPLRLGAAIQMAIAFQVAILVVGAARRVWGATGIFAIAAGLGLTDMDALTVSMSRPDAGIAVVVAARAIAIGLLANTLLKLTLAVTIGRATYRRRAGIGLASLAIGSIAGLVFA